MEKDDSHDRVSQRDIEATLARVVQLVIGKKIDPKEAVRLGSCLSLKGLVGLKYAYKVAPPVIPPPADLMIRTPSGIRSLDLQNNTIDPLTGWYRR